MTKEFQPIKVWATIANKITNKMTKLNGKNGELNRQLSRMNNKGMTLIEIMIVLVIVGGLIAILGGNVISKLGKAQTQEAAIQIKEIGKSLDMFYADCGFYPKSDQGLSALVESKGDCQNWGPDPYLKKVPNDPWSNAYLYEQKSRNSYTLRSLGADGAEGGEGKNKDISSDEL